MGNLNEKSVWHVGVPYFAADAVLTGGPDCPDNIPIQALVDRTRYLKEKVEEVQGDVSRHKENGDPHPQYMTPAEGDQRYLGLGGGTLTGPLWLLYQGFKQINAGGDGDLEIVHRGNGDVSIYVNNGSNRIARFTRMGRMILGEAVDNERDTLQIAGSVCAASPADGADNNQLPPTAWVNRRISAALASLVNSSPAALDTLNELATALGNDPNFATTIMNLLAGKAPRATTLAGYGIADGVGTQLVSVSSFDDRIVTESGFFLVTIAAENAAESPSGEPDQFMVTSVGGQALTAAKSQLAVSRGSGAMYLRHKSSDEGWWPWRKIATAATTLAGYGITDAVPISAFTGANKSLEENGYQVLPGGLIFQWGRVSVPASTQTIVALPMTFPLAHHNSQATGTISNGVEPEVAVISRSLNSITLITDYAQTVDWFAIGK